MFTDDNQQTSDYTQPVDFTAKLKNVSSPISIPRAADSCQGSESPGTESVDTADIDYTEIYNLMMTPPPSVLPVSSAALQELPAAIIPRLHLDPDSKQVSDNLAEEKIEVKKPRYNLMDTMFGNCVYSDSVSLAELAVNGNESNNHGLDHNNNDNTCDPPILHCLKNGIASSSNNLGSINGIDKSKSYTMQDSLPIIDGYQQDNQPITESRPRYTLLDIRM
jgi:hypothetical protein